jgi:hypothetical protein
VAKPDHPRQDGHLHDPDPWTWLSLAISAVTMMAQLVGLRYQIGSRPVGPTTDDPYTRDACERLKNAVENAIQRVEQLLRITGQAAGDRGAPLEARFAFGASRMFLPDHEMSRYSKAVADLAFAAGTISRWTLVLVRVDPPLAQRLADEIGSKLGRVHDRVNQLYRSEPRNEDVAEECLRMLRELHQILDRVDRLRC